jgi:hypothetical protein
MGERGYCFTLLDLVTRWRSVVSFTTLSLCPGERAAGTHRIGDWVGPRVGVDGVRERKILHCRESNPGNPVVTPSELSPLLHEYVM